MKYKNVKLKDIVRFINGFPFKPTDWGNEGYKIIRIQNLTDRLKPYNFTNKVVPDNFKVKRGDLLVSWSATIDIFEWADTDAYLNQHIFKVQYNDEVVHKNYFKYAIRKTINDLSKYAHGSTMKHLVKNDFDNHEIPLPQLEDQIRIASLLSRIEELIAKRKESIRLLDEFVKSTFLEMFGDPVRNEKGWENIKLGNISSIQGGLQVTTKRDDYPIELPYLRVANVYRDLLILEEIKTIRVTENEAERVCLKKGDILIVEGHGNPTEIGRSAVWNGSIKNCLHQNHLIRVRVDTNYAKPIFISYFINSPSGRLQMFKAGKTTSGLNTISTKNVYNTMVILPPISIQNQFIAISEKILTIKIKFNKNLSELKKFYESVCQRAFIGEM